MKSTFHILHSSQASFHLHKARIQRSSSQCLYCPMAFPVLIKVPFRPVCLCCLFPLLFPCFLLIIWVEVQYMAKQTAFHVKVHLSGSYSVCSFPVLLMWAWHQRSFLSNASNAKLKNTGIFTSTVDSLFPPLSHRRYADCSPWQSIKISWAYKFQCVAHFWMSSVCNESINPWGVRDWWGIVWLCLF